MSCAADEQKLSSPEILYSLTPIKPHTWWMTYIRESTNDTGIQKDEETSGVTLNIERNLNESLINIGVIDGNESDIGNVSGNHLNWKMVREVSNDVMTEMATLDEGPGADDETTEERKVEKGKDVKYLGECSSIVLFTLILKVLSHSIHISLMVYL